MASSSDPGFNDGEPFPDLETLSRRYPSPEALRARLDDVQRREVRLHHEAGLLQALVNRHHNASVPIARIPPEVLQSIFLLDHLPLATREIYPRNLELMAVSHHFMTTVSGYARLWSTFAIRLTGRQRDSPAHIHALGERTRLHVARAKQAPLSLYVGTGVGQVVQAYVLEALPRCWELDIHAFDDSTRDVEPIPGSHLLSGLQSLTISANKRDDEGRASRILPDLGDSGCHLQRLTVLDCEYDALTWSQYFPLNCTTPSLVSLTVRSSIDPHGLAWVLRNLPQLQYLHYTRDATSALAAPPPSQGVFPFVLVHLESLIIAGETDVLRGLGAMGAPNLQHLRIQRTYVQRGAVQTEIPEWLAPQGVTRFRRLRTLTDLNYIEWVPSDVERVLKAHTMLEHVYAPVHSDNNVEAYGVLANPNVCPRLRTLQLQFVYTWSMDTVLRMMERVASRNHHLQQPRASPSALASSSFGGSHRPAPSSSSVSSAATSSTATLTLHPPPQVWSPGSGGSGHSSPTHASTMSPGSTPASVSSSSAPSPPASPVPQPHESISQMEPAPPHPALLSVRLDVSRHTSDFARTLGRIFGRDPDDVVGPLTPFEIPVV